MIRTGSKEDKDYTQFYGDEEKENAAGNGLVKVAALAVASLIVIGGCVLLFQIFTNQDLHDAKLPWETPYIKNLEELK